MSFTTNGTFSIMVGAPPGRQTTYYVTVVYGTTYLKNWVPVVVGD